VNRWQSWAGRLRQRHSRIDAWRAQGAMVLLRGAPAPTPGARNTLRTIIHLHMRLAVSPRCTLSLLPAPTAPVTLRQVVPGATVRNAEPAGVVPGTASESRMQVASTRAPDRATAPAFVPRMAARARAGLRLPPSVPVVRLSLRHRDNVSRVAAPPHEIAARLRRGATRHELPPPPTAAVLAAPRRAAGHSGATELQAGLQAAAPRQQADAPRLAQSVPAINVEALTGMVIQQIDRRLVAYRERMGRA